MTLTSYVHSLESLSLKCVPPTIVIQTQVLDGPMLPCWVILYIYSMLFCHINSYNRFKPLERQLAVRIGGSNLRELRLNGCQLTWDQVSLFDDRFRSMSPFHLSFSIHCRSLVILAFAYELLALYPGSYGYTRIPFTSQL